MAHWWPGPVGRRRSVDVVLELDGGGRWVAPWLWSPPSGEVEGWGSGCGSPPLVRCEESERRERWKMGIEEMGLATEGEGFMRDRARGSSGRPHLALGLGLDGPGGRPSGEGAGWALEGCGPASLLSLSLFF